MNFKGYDADGLAMYESAHEVTHAIPAPTDTAEAAMWRAGVARRRAEGRGLLVGDA